MQITRKDAAIVEAPDQSAAGPGTFEAILSAPTQDRDGDTLLPDEWKQPLPERITVDIDHEMSVKGTIGSAHPWIDDDGNLRISGTFASTPLAQEVRTLMAEGHIDRTSVAFMSEPATTKDGKKVKVRELLNAAVVAIPSNREAAVLQVRGLKTGARNSKSDAEHIQAIHDHALALGATPVAKSYPTDRPLYMDSVGLVGWIRKMAGDEDTADPAAIASGLDAALDEAIDLLNQVDPATLPAEVQQAIALLQAADVAADELLDALGVVDPDEDADSGATAAPASGAEKSAPVAGAPVAPVEVTDSDVTNRLLQIRLAAFQQ